jgi:glycerol-3-phosphate acyltransferase PlsX
VLLIDSGANTECTPEYLLQFAFMGSFYMQKVVGLEKPRVGLINNGTEDTKGDPLRKEAYALLKKAGDEGRIHFVGNVEGSDIMLGTCDVAVTDGFTGNVVLKTIEGAAKFLGSGIKKVFLTNVRTKLGYLLVKPQLKSFMQVMDSSEVGGAPFLGVSKPVFKAHGASDARAIRSAIMQAIRYVEGDVVKTIEENIDQMTL